MQKIRLVRWKMAKIWPNCDFGLSVDQWFQYRIEIAKCAHVRAIFFCFLWTNIVYTISTQHKIGESSWYIPFGPCQDTLSLIVIEAECWKVLFLAPLWHWCYKWSIIRAECWNCTFWHHFVIVAPNGLLYRLIGESTIFGITLSLVLQMVPCTGRM